MNPKEYIKDIILNGTPEQKREVFQFDSNDSNEKVCKKFKLFARSQLIRYFENDPAPFHNGMILRTIKSYRGANSADVGFRGSAKTTLKKLLRVYLLLNDKDHYRKYLKVLCRDIMNSKQIVTDIYNMCLELSPIYGNVFEKQGEKKVEETMTSFTMASGVKLTAGTVGQKQRGHIQDAYRPDWVWFEDIEDSESVSSQVITLGVIKKCDEAITGLSKNGSWELTANYISDAGSVQWFLDKKNILKEITPIATDLKILNKKVIEAIPTWDIYSIANIQALYDDSLDFFGDYMCLKPDTLIHTHNGLQEIKDIKVNDLVWTHKGRLQKVLNVFENESGEMLDITVEGKIVTITKNHPVLVMRGEKEVWIEAGDLALNDLLLKSSMLNFTHAEY